MADLKVQLRDLLKPFDVVTGELHRITLTAKTGGVLEMEDVNFHFDSAVLLPERSGDAGTTTAQDRVTGIDVLAIALLEAKNNPSNLLLIAGHTDRVGTVQYNLTLSQMRADNVLFALSGKRQEWGDSAQAKHQVEDYQAILAWASNTFGFECDPEGIDGVAGAKTSSALRNFQREYSADFGPAIGIDGVIGPATWRAFFDLYIDQLKTKLDVDDQGLADLRKPFTSGSGFLDSAKRTVGCGFNHPVSSERLRPADTKGSSKADSPSAFKSAEDRRVELLFFPPGQRPKLDCHPAKGKCNAALCEIYVGNHFEFDYIPGDQPTVVEFFGRPAALDGQPDKPHNVIVAQNAPAVLHWSVKNADRVEIVGTALDGTQTTVSLPAGGIVAKSATPQIGSATVAASQDTTFSLSAFDRTRRVRHAQFVHVHAVLPGATTPTQVVTGTDNLDEVNPASPTEVLARALSQPTTDARLAGPVQAPAIPPQVPPRSAATAPRSSAPLLLTFQPIPVCLADLSEQAIRAMAVSTIRSFFGFGVANLPKGRRDAYADIIGFDESNGVREGLLKKTLQNSSCALVIRALWWMLGCRDFITSPPFDPKAKGKPPIQDGFLLAPPRPPDDKLFGRLFRFASLCGAFHRVHTDDEISAFNPQAGDAVFLTKTVEKPDPKDPSKVQAISQQHIFTITKRVGSVFFSIDGGQPSPQKLADGRPLRLPGAPQPDGPCCGIWAQQRTLGGGAQSEVVVDRTGLSKEQLGGRPPVETANRLKFTKDQRPIDAWIDVAKLKFSANVIGLVKNMGNLTPGLPEDGIVPNVAGASIDAQSP